MFVVSCSCMHLLDVVATRCSLPFHSYLREIMDDGVMLGGVELEFDVPGSDSGSMRRFFWAQDGVDFFSLYEKAAFQAICFLQNLYGFVILDYNFECMSTYRELARSVVLLAAMMLRSAMPVGCADALAAVIDHDVLLQRQMLHARLVSTACNI
ncbi:hypothetical protein CFC21_083206 [Triticum aestivum]|uniref:Uncharacterized protein n=2 Tax=Triticum aestivum TaxID=4565 RepID=A0A3B6NP58_WHEAT|nr:hypothetical protein CFC21_083206 [Triticum aestivum]